MCLGYYGGGSGGGGGGGGGGGAGGVRQPCKRYALSYKSHDI